MAHFITVGQLDQVIDALCTANDSRFLKLEDVVKFTIKEEATPTSGYFKTYKLYSVSADDPAVETPVEGAAAINIPKDFLVKSATLSTVTSSDKEEGGKFENDSTFAIGDKYIDFVINTKDSAQGTATNEHIYLNVKDLVDTGTTYTAGNGIDISQANAISVKIDSQNANGLSVGANGLKLDVAATTYVAATGTYVSGTTYYTDSTGATVVDTSSFVEGSTDVSSYYVAQTTAGAMSAEDKVKLDSIAEATSGEISAIISGMYATV